MTFGEKVGVLAVFSPETIKGSSGNKTPRNLI